MTQPILRRRIAHGESQMKSKYDVDKENVDYIADKIAKREPIKEWVCMYWLAVAVGHILEWIVKHGKE